MIALTPTRAATSASVAFLKFRTISDFQPHLDDESYLTPLTYASATPYDSANIENHAGEERMVGLCRNVVVMGVCGVGKSTVASRLAARCEGHFLEGDQFHPPENVGAMAGGIPLTDKERWAWLGAICHGIAALNARDAAPVFLACSALKRSYRTLLRDRTGPLAIIHLDGDSAIIRQRLHARPNHFMPPSLLDSQLRDLEPPDTHAEAPACRLDVARSLDEIIDEAERFCRRHVASAGRSPSGEKPSRQQIP
ncbi:Gluconokinase (plasmid) [Nitratireductor thuwali]|uniref:Gluconokinase n=1 Tax=Nitratireductor thuwali TaxID=2267699 RepID=A0ABY5MPC1_9HYPH|nr:Gluconokinase [Nitratireductor thuwali]